MLQIEPENKQSPSLFQRNKHLYFYTTDHTFLCIALCKETSNVMLTFQIKIAIVRTCSEKQISLECYTSESKIQKFEIVEVTGVFYMLKIPLNFVGFSQKRQTLLSLLDYCKTRQY